MATKAANAGEPLTRQALTWTVLVFKALERWTQPGRLDVAMHLRTVAVAIAAQTAGVLTGNRASMAWSCLQVQRNLAEAVTLLTVARQLGYLTRARFTALLDPLAAIQIALTQATRVPRSRRRTLSR